MNRTSLVRIVLVTWGLTTTAPRAFGGAPNDPNRYLNAVRTFADNVLKYGRDTYGPKHTPLFVDGLNIHTHEPVKWIAPNGDRWILSNLASQQNLFRTLHGLTTITGDPKYKQAAMDAIKYAFENLRSPNGLLYWGGHIAYDAGADKPCGRGVHELKGFYAYYELMWEVDPQATRQFIEAFWSGHILDWSSLDMDRHCYRMSEPLGKPWKHEYKGGPVFFVGKGLDTNTTGSDLFHAASLLTRFTGDREPLVWAKRLAHRYVETRDPQTGISVPWFTAAFREGVQSQFSDAVLRKLVPAGYVFPHTSSANRALGMCSLGYEMPTPGTIVSRVASPWVCQLMVGDLLREDGKEFIQWAVEELTAWGKVAYRARDNAYVPMFPDGTRLEGYVCKEDGPLGFKGTKLEPVPVGTTDFWAYVLAYCLTTDDFMWEMARRVALGNNYGDLGARATEEPRLNLQTESSDPYAVVVFLELHRKTGNQAFLEMARKIGDNILTHRVHNAFFAPDARNTFTKFDAIDPLVLLHLYSALVGDRIVRIPKVWPAKPFFDVEYRHKDLVVDNQIIYTLTELPEPPRSLQEAAAEGDLETVRSMIAQGVDVDFREDSFLKTALHRAAMSGHRDVVEFLLAKGARVEARDGWPGRTALHYAAERDHGEIALVLLAAGANVNAGGANVTATSSGDTPLQYAVFSDRKDVIQLLLSKGAAISTLHLAAYVGDIEKAETLVNDGVDISALDDHGYAPLHYAARNSQKRTVELLLARGADANVKNWSGETPLFVACGRSHTDIAELLLNKGANISTADNRGNTLLHRAVQDGRKDMAEFLTTKGADVNAKNNAGQTPLDIAADRNRKEIVELLLAKGAAVSTLHQAAGLGDLDRVRAFLEKGTDVNAKDKNGQTALHIAASSRQKDAADLLIARGADINTKDNRNYTPLFYAIFSNDANAVELLVSKGADVNYTPEKGYPPLHYAVWYENKDMVKILVDHGAKFDVEDADGWTAFRYAASQGNRDIVDLFVAKGADVSGFHMAACAGKLARVKELVEQGADINAQDKLGWTPLYCAASLGRTEVAAFLIAKGADVRTAATDSGTALHQAAQAGDLALVELMLSKGADVKAKTKRGNMPLHNAASAGHREVLALLIAKGAEINAKTAVDRTPLHNAVLGNHKAVVDLLIKAGADASMKDRQGRTALAWAEQRKYTEIVDFLRRHGAKE